MITKVVKVARPRMAKIKKATRQAVATPSSGRPQPSPRTVATVAAKIKEMATAMTRLMVDQLALAMVSWDTIKPWYVPPRSPPIPIAKKAHRQLG